MSLRHWEVETFRPAPATSWDWALWREALTSFDDLAAFRTAEHNLDAGTGGALPVASAEVTASTFALLGTRPLLGRTLDAADERPGAPDVVLLGHDVWRARLAGDPEVVGSTVRVSGVPHTVVGVLPRGFRFPESHQLWLPLRERPPLTPAAGVPLAVFGRLAEGVSRGTAQLELTRTAREEAVRSPEVYGRLDAEVVAFAVERFGLPRGGFRSLPGVWIFPVFTLALLGVACVNVGLGVFARVATRAGELAVRTALGASRGRILAQVFTEALVLAVLAAAGGMLLAAWLPDRVLPAMWSPALGGFPWWVDLDPTPGTVGLALLLAVLSAAVAAVLPALRVTGKGVRRNLQRAAAARSGVRFGGVSGLLIAADMALAVAVVGLVAGIAGRLENVMLAPELAGLADERVLAVGLRVPEAPSPGETDGADASAREDRLARIQDALLERLAAEPAVRSVGVADALPRMDHPSRLVEVEGGAEPTALPVARVAPDFFDALGQPVLAGRGFGAGDLAAGAPGEAPPVIVNAGFSRRMLGGRSPVGRRLRYLASRTREPGPWHEIVGMVPDLGMNLVEPEDSGAGIYHPAEPGRIHPLRLAVQLGGDPAAFAHGSGSWSGRWTRP